MTETLFADDKTTVDQTKNYLEDLVGDGKKFKDVNELAKGKAQSDEYISQLTSRLDQQRAEYMELYEKANKRASFEDLVNQMKDSKTNPNMNLDTPVPKDLPRQDSTNIEDQVAKAVARLEQQKTQSQNFNQVVSKLKEKWGENYPQNLNAHAANLGLSQDYVNQLASTHPQVFYRTFGLEEQPVRTPYQSAPRSDVTSTFTPKTQERNWSFYQKMRKENPALYKSRETTIQMHKDGETLGASFFDTD